MSELRNPAAFPRLHKWKADSSGAACNTGYEAKEYTDGMTLLDYFAASALQGILAGQFADTIPHDDINGGADAAFFAYQYAEAMLARRAEINRQLQEK